jgi:hypothetical protein
MNYINWAMEYKAEADNLLNTINKEKVNLKNAFTQDDKKNINTRIQILTSMYYEAKLTYELLIEREFQHKEKSAGDFVA